MQLVDTGWFVIKISSRKIPLVGSWQLLGEARQQSSTYNVTATRVVQPRGWSRSLHQFFVCAAW